MSDNVSYYMVWNQGRQLTYLDYATNANNETQIHFAYDADGIRTQKNVNGVIHNYITQNGKVVRETIGTGATAKVLDFIYDADGRPFALRYSTNGGSSFTIYYYVLNLQGDVVALMTGNRTVVAKYSYNAWGELLSVTNANDVPITNASHIGNLNPLRYRGYYYDSETGFYYLQSRYYDPTMHRFINADSLASTGQGVTGTNMFAYCGNNPVRRTEVGGNYWISDFWEDVCETVSEVWEETCETVSTAAEAAGEFVSDTFGAALYRSNNFKTMTLKTFFGGAETGKNSSALLKGNDRKPVVFYNQIGSDWYNIDEYTMGVMVNMGSTSISVDRNIFGETTMSFSNENTTIDLIAGINKVGATWWYADDLGVERYDHIYLRPWTIIPTAYAVVTGVGYLSTAIRTLPLASPAIIAAL